MYDMETKRGKHLIDSALNIAKVTKNSSSKRNRSLLYLESRGLQVQTGE